MKSIYVVALIFTFHIFDLTGESLIILNQTGFPLVDLRIQNGEEQGLSSNLIPYGVILDKDYLELEYPGPGPFILRLQDEEGDIYLQRLENSSLKAVITLEDLQIFQGEEAGLSVRLSNRTGMPITALFISPTGKEEWGEDLLAGKMFRQDQVWETQLPPSEYSRYDLQFTCFDQGEWQDYRLDGVTFHDRGLFLLELQ